MSERSWSRTEFQTALRERHPDISEPTIDDALALLEIPHERKIWHSENYPTTKPERAAVCLAAWLSIADQLEPLLISEASTYEYDWHPLDRLIVASQFMWHWYELREAEPLIERVVNFAGSAMTPSELYLMPRTTIQHDIDEASLHEVYLSARHFHTCWYYLAEIAEARDDPEIALDRYERFLFAEPEFAPLEPLARDEWFYYLRRFVPNSVEACRRAGLCAERLGRVARARELYDYALSLRFTRFSPLRERAALRMAEGRREQAMLDELAYLDGLGIAYGESLADREMFERYLELGERFDAEGMPVHARLCKLQAAGFVQTKLVARDNYNYGGTVRAVRRISPELHGKLREQAEAAERAGDQELMHAFAEPDFLATLTRALDVQGDRTHVAAIERQLERLRLAGQLVALGRACATIELQIEHSLLGPTPRRLSRPDITDELAALIALYRERL